MGKMDILEKQKYIFGSIFLLSNKLQVIMDRELVGHDMTTKQWFLTAVIEELFSNSPTLNEVAKAMGSSRQNVKQIALNLQKKSFLKIEKDEKDRRALRLKLTDKSYAFWQNREKEDKLFLKELFGELSIDEINGMYKGVTKLIAKIKELE